jgi:23S rRNA (uracil1939-C5)-methyltransferase
MHIGEDAQLRHKEEIVVSALEHLGEVERGSYQLKGTVRSGEPLAYRRRAALHPVGAALGFFGRGTHDRVAVTRCPALTPALADFPAKLASLLGANTLKELDEVRLLECEGRVSLSLHLKQQVRPRHREAMTLALREGLIDGAVLQPGEGKGQGELLGAPVLEEEGVLHRPDGFAQANAGVNRRLVHDAIELLDPQAGDRVLELYAGNGNFTFRLAPHVAQVVAVESSALSVALAQQAALKRGVTNVRLVQGDSEKIAQGMVREGQRFERLLVDPPRSGAPGIGAWASGLIAQRLVYVACDPTSLARDAKELIGRGYHPLALQLFDLFPQTHHIEAVMAFGR